MRHSDSARNARATPDLREQSGASALHIAAPDERGYFGEDVDHWSLEAARIPPVQPAWREQSR
jgi:hypothetical protein